MKRIFSIIVTVLIFAGLASCASSPAAAGSGSSVWKISRDGKSLYLGGSVHVLRNTDFPLPQEFDTAFSQSEILVLEADIEQMADEGVAQYLISKMLLPGETTLQSILDADTYKLLVAAYAEYGVSISEVSKLKPSMAVNILTIFQIQKYGFVLQGVDSYYLEKARTENKPVNFLETVQTQIDMLVNMGDGYENDFVRYSLQDMASAETELETLLAEWKKGSASITEKAISEMREQWPEIYKTLLADRNAAWMPQIERFLADRPVCFVVVGLMHLHGPDGLLRQLGNSGYAVERLK